MQPATRITHLFLLVCTAILTIISGYLQPAIAQEEEKDVPYVPSPDTVVEKMLDMANVHSGDYLIDLGSGDGRIAIAAAKRGAYAHGIEIDSSLVHKARQKAVKAGVDNRVAFIQGDLFNHDISRASVITMYLFPDILKKLKPTLLNTLEPGTRIVSHLFRMGDWRPDKQIVIKPDLLIKRRSQPQEPSLTELNELLSINDYNADNLFPEHNIYFWVVPADVAGTWRWSIGSQEFSATIQQHNQEIYPSISSDGLSYKIIESNLRGRQISFAVDRGNVRYNYSGHVKNDTIRGQIQVHRPTSTSIREWKAIQTSEHQ